jgi:enoyl-[acyl-carrier-protein] reductase (NADH)
VRYLAAELGERGIRVFAVSPGPLKTRAASGIAAFDELIDDAVARAPACRLVDIGEVGRVVAFLVGGASGMTGDTIYIDAGLHIVAWNRWPHAGESSRLQLKRRRNARWGVLTNEKRIADESDSVSAAGRAR